MVPAAGLVVELCCGAGGISLALRRRTTAREVHAADIDPQAVRCARSNLEAVGVRVHEGDLYAALPQALRGRVDLVVANAPYVPSSLLPTLPREAREHEPWRALDGGEAGLTVLERVIREAPAWLAPGGGIAVECSVAQGPDVRRLMEGHGLRATISTSDDLEVSVVSGRRGRLDLEDRLRHHWRDEEEGGGPPAHSEERKA
jgi:release factor glutamine methyltransferase